MIGQTVMDTTDCSGLLYCGKDGLVREPKNDKKKNADVLDFFRFFFFFKYVSFHYPPVTP